MDHDLQIFWMNHSIPGGRKLLEKQIFHDPEEVSPLQTDTDSEEEALELQESPFPRFLAKNKFRGMFEQPRLR